MAVIQRYDGGPLWLDAKESGQRLRMPVSRFVERQGRTLLKALGLTAADLADRSVVERKIEPLARSILIEGVAGLRADVRTQTVSTAEDLIRGWFAWRVAQPKPLKSRTALANRVDYVCRHVIKGRETTALLDTTTWDGVHTNYTRAVAKPAVNWALARGLLHGRTPFGRYGVSTTDTSSRDVVIAAEDVRRGLARLSGDAWAYVAGLWHTGARPVEWALLRPQDIEQRGYVTFPAAHTKTGKARVVPFDVRSAIGRWLIERVGDPASYVFCRRQASGDLTDFGLSISVRFRRWWNSDVRPHLRGAPVMRDLRRSRASFYDSCRVAWADSQYLLGHANGTHGRYRRADLARLSAAWGSGTSVGPTSWIAYSTSPAP
jgi:hypothetical protein